MPVEMVGSRRGSAARGVQREAVSRRTVRRARMAWQAETSRTGSGVADHRDFMALFTVIMRGGDARTVGGTAGFEETVAWGPRSHFLEPACLRLTTARFFSFAGSSQMCVGWRD